jgi:hypothetical protein
MQDSPILGQTTQYWQNQLLKPQAGPKAILPKGLSVDPNLFAKLGLSSKNSESETLNLPKVFDLLVY